MLHDMYSVQQIPIERIARTLYTPIYSLRKRFDEIGLSVRTRGGRHNVKIEMTPELYAEACRDGTRCVALRLGVDEMTLRWRIRSYYEELQKEKKREAQEEQKEEEQEEQP